MFAAFAVYFSPSKCPERAQSFVFGILLKVFGTFDDRLPIASL
jgi:hypothetical protein